MKPKIIFYLNIFIVMCGWVTNVHAQFMDTVAIHGFGGWAYGKTDNENRYLVGNEDGNYENVDFALNIAANPYENLSLYIQPSYTETSDRDEVGLDYAFAEVFLSDAAILRVGKVKAPFMIYSEVYNVGTIRPFFKLPQVVYEELAAEAYKGLGITGSFLLGSEWEFLYDLYGGKLELFPQRIVIVSDRPKIGFIEPRVQDMVGGRFTVHTPIDGFSVGLSSYIGDFVFAIENRPDLKYPIDDRYVIFGTSVEYLSDHWWIRSEYLTQKGNESKLKLDAAYVEVALQFMEHWQIAARYEFFDSEVSVPELQVFPESFLEKQEVALGLNYWLNPNLAFKVSYHIVDGNRHANPEKVQDFIESLLLGSFDESTTLLSVGVQFSF